MGFWDGAWGLDTICTQDWAVDSEGPLLSPEFLPWLGTGLVMGNEVLARGNVPCLLGMVDGKCGCLRQPGM